MILMGQTDESLRHNEKRMQAQIYNVGFAGCCCRGVIFRLRVVSFSEEAFSHVCNRGSGILPFAAYRSAVREGPSHKRGGFYRPCFHHQTKKPCMQHFCELLYRRLQRELQACQQSGLSREKQIEHSFRIASCYWRILQKRVCGYQFPTPEAEIHFFKSIKPLFTAEISYHNFCYAALLFQPCLPAEAVLFWQWEQKRLDRAIRQDHVFYHYLKEGKSCLDDNYFLRRHLADETLAAAKVFDNEPCALTCKDPLVATFMALERYQTFAESQLMHVLAIT